jgi:hypothetical protein
MSANEDHHVVAVYFGNDTDCLFVRSLLEGSGIAAFVRNFSMSGAVLGASDVRVFVARNDVDRAKLLVDDFRKQA